MEVVRRYTQRVLAFYDGKIIADGQPTAVLDDPAVRKYVVGERLAAPVAREGDAC
jgi:branched-chain amino acid transport system ATP-binding protein